MASWPNPGQAKTVSTTKEPVTREPKVTPEKVRTGIRALRRACFQMTFGPVTHLALANFTYSESSTFSIEERSRRKLAAA